VLRVEVFRRDARPYDSEEFFHVANYTIIRHIAMAGIRRLREAENQKKTRNQEIEKTTIVNFHFL